MTYVAPVRPGDTVYYAGEHRHVPYFFPHLNVLFSAAFLGAGGYRWDPAWAPGKGKLYLDSGAFTTYRKGLKALEPAELADMAGVVRPDHVFHTDIPVSFWRRSLSLQCELCEFYDSQASPQQPSGRLMLERNLTLALACWSFVRQRAPGTTLVPVAQGMAPLHYADQVRHLSDLSDYVAVGGLGGRPVREKVAVLREACAEATRKDVRLHVLGCGNLDLLRDLLEPRGPVASFDAASPGDDAHRDSDGTSTFLYWLDGGSLLKLRLSELRAEVKSGNHGALPECECPLCEAFGPEIIQAGSAQRNRARAMHNYAVFDELVRRNWQ